MWGYLRFNESAGFYNYSDKSVKLWSDKDVSIGSSSSTCCTFTGTSFQIYNNRSIDFYSPLNLHGWGYTNNSDVRLKTNIKDTAIRGLEVVNAIDLKEFDWIQSGEHQAMAKIYASLIIKGVKTLDDVPDRLKEAVKAILEGDN